MEINRTLTGPDLVAHVFDVLQYASQIDITETDQVHTVRALVPRLLDLKRDNPELDIYAEAINALARVVGLWNYLDDDQVSFRDALLIEMAKIDELDGLKFHREQFRILNKIEEGANLIISAPTSFGKSIIIDATIIRLGVKSCVVIVPTIALLDEMRRRLQRRFGKTHDIITHLDQPIIRDKWIVIGTQERVKARSDIESIDLLVVDEFYKLDPDREDGRYIALNQAAHRMLKKSKQFLFLGPNISSVEISANSDWKFEFFGTKFSTVATDIYDLRKMPGGKFEKLVSIVNDDSNKPLLVYASGPARANTLVSKLSEAQSVKQSCIKLADWIEANYGPSWGLVNAVRRGIAVHHGQTPRSLAGIFIRYFDGKMIDTLVCTSTLIEGVNTSAHAVAVYDAKVGSDSYDFFTFSNIKGRAGRLGKHLTGKVFLFEEPPQEVGADVVAPVLGDPDDVEDEVAMDYDPSDLSDKRNAELNDLSIERGISRELLAKYSSLSFDALERIANSLRYKTDLEPFIWASGLPSMSELYALSGYLYENVDGNLLGAYSQNQLYFFMKNIQLKSSMKEFFLENDLRSDGNRTHYEQVFRFLRQAEFQIPQILGAIQDISREKHNVALKLEYYIQQLENWFLPRSVKVLDEFGVPIQISERFASLGVSSNDLSSTLVDAAKDGRLDEFEASLILEALG